MIAIEVTLEPPYVQLFLLYADAEERKFGRNEGELVGQKTTLFLLLNG